MNNEEVECVVRYGRMLIKKRIFLTLRGGVFQSVCVVAQKNLEFWGRETFDNLLSL